MLEQQMRTVQLPGISEITGKQIGFGEMPRYSMVREKENDVLFYNSPLPICPECKDTKHVCNMYKGPYPPMLECSQCHVRWNCQGNVFDAPKHDLDSNHGTD